MTAPKASKIWQGKEANGLHSELCIIAPDATELRGVANTMPRWKGQKHESNHYTTNHTRGELHLRKLYSDDPKHGERMTSEAVGIYTIRSLSSPTINI